MTENSNNTEPQPPYDAQGSEPATSPEYAEFALTIVRDGVRKFGEAFLAYLVLDGVDQRDFDLLDQFEDRFLGFFPGRREFVLWAFEDKGWVGALAEFRREQGMWPDDVKWHLDAAWDHLSGSYAVTERLGGVYAFKR